MKKLLLATSIAALAATSANAAPKVYGKAFVSFDYIMSENTAGVESSTTEVNSNASRIGFKGSEKLTNDLKAIYKAEYQINVDDGESKDKTFNQRNIYAGLASKRFGTLQGGNFDTPLKTAQKKIDLFNDLAGGATDMKNTFAGELRQSDMIQYTTPKAGIPVSLQVAVAVDEDEKLDDSTEDRDHAYFAKAAYEANGLYAAIAGAWDADLKGKGYLDDLDGDIIRLVGQYKMGNTQLGAMYQMADADESSAEEKGFLLSAKYKIPASKFAVKAQAQRSSQEMTGSKDRDVTQIAVGGEYSFSKMVKAHAYYANRKTDTNTAGEQDATDSVLGTGLEVKF